MELKAKYRLTCVPTPRPNLHPDDQQSNGTKKVWLNLGCFRKILSILTVWSYSDNGLIGCNCDQKYNYSSWYN